MGGKSSSSQQTANNQSTTNLVNDGEFAGASDIFIDESDRSVSDSNNTEFNLDQETDSSVNDSYNTEYQLEQDIDNSVNDSNNTTTEYRLEQDIDNSVNDSNNTTTEYRLEQDIDNSISQEYDYSGDNAGNTGTINITTVDGGAIKAAEEISKAAIDAARKQSEINQKIVNDSLSQSFGFGEKAVAQVGNTANKAIDTVSDTANKALNEVSEFGEKAVDTVSSNLTKQSESFARGLTALSQSSASISQKVLADAAAASSEDKGIIADLARSTSLAGQDLVASASQKMVLYIAVALGVMGISAAIAIGARR